MSRLVSERKISKDVAVPITGYMHNVSIYVSLLLSLAVLPANMVKLRKCTSYPLCYNKDGLDAILGWIQIFF